MPLTRATRRSSSRRRQPRRRREDERGSATAEALLVLPALMLLLVAGLQLALYGLASHAAALAAEEAGAAARSALGTSGAAAALARGDVRAIASGLLVDPVVTVTETHGRAEVTVRGGVPELLPGLHLSVRAVSAGPPQEFRPA